MGELSSGAGRAGSRERLPGTYCSYCQSPAKKKDLIHVAGRAWLHRGACVWSKPKEASNAR